MVESNLLKELQELIIQWTNVDLIRENSLNDDAIQRFFRVFDALQNNNLDFLSTLLSAQYDLTNVCNSKCIHCNIWKWKDKSQLGYEKIILMLQYLSDNGLKSVTFSGGEPLLHPNFKKIVIEGKAIGLKLSVLSNGLILKQEIAEILCKYMEWVRFSIDGANPVIYSKCRGVDKFQQVISNVKQLVYTKKNILEKLK